VPLDLKPDHSHQRDTVPRRHDAVVQSEIEEHLTILDPFFEMHIA
jgi:hypothetical protein